MKRLEELDTVFSGGAHNSDLEASRTRLLKGKTYENLSTVWVTPIPEDPPMVPAKVVFQSWMNLMTPMNQMIFRIPMVGMEVGDAYNQAVEMILDHPQLSKAKYMLTVEWDNLPPPDGLLKLYESMSKYDVVGGLYWTKGENGQPMIYGDPKIMPRNYIPQVPQINTVQPCNGLGMGFTLFKLSIFKKIPKPWFKTLQKIENGATSMATQDLFFFAKAATEGFKFACDTRVKVGHLDIKEGFVW
jgi:hypothetical protein